MSKQSPEYRLWKLGRTNGPGSSANNYKEGDGRSFLIKSDLKDISNLKIGKLNLVFRMGHNGMTTVSG